MTILNIYALGQKIPAGAIYIGRCNMALGLPGSRFANPYPITPVMGREEVLSAYKQWLWAEINSGRLPLTELLALKGKDLVCYCAPKACHGHVIEQAIEFFSR